MSSLTIVQTGVLIFRPPVLSAGLESEQLVSGTELKDTCCQRDDTDPAPHDILTDYLVTDEYQAQ